MIPIQQGRRVRYGKDNEQIVEDFEGYYLTTDELTKLIKDYIFENGGYIRINKAWIETKLKEL